jgi:hypothetical protein
MTRELSSWRTGANLLLLVPIQSLWLPNAMTWVLAWSGSPFFVRLDGVNSHGGYDLDMTVFVGVFFTRQSNVCIHLLESIGFFNI